jgi:Zn finger protein HypA/HybF involved in hydrogenase expression
MAKPVAEIADELAWRSVRARGTVPPAASNALALAKADLSITCPTCATEMRPEHAHYKCPQCGYRDSCCF